MLHLVVVCSGNICRSPMGEALLARAGDEAGLSDSVRVTSCGMGSWHVGQKADSRARRELARHGIDGEGLRASAFGPEDARADLLLAMDRGHKRRLLAEGVDEDRVALWRSFDPDSPAHAEVPDPYYGDEEDFAHAYELIEAAVPGILSWIRSH